MDFHSDDFGTSDGHQGEVTTAAWATADRLGYAGFYASKFSQGFIHAHQNRTDLLGHSGAYDAGHNVARSLMTAA
jgi:hypothetical protein